MGAQAVVVTIDLVLVLLLLDQLDLVGDPVLLHIGGLIINLLDLLLDIVAMVFDGADVLIAITTASEVGALTIETIDLEGLLLDSQETCLDVLLNLLDITLLLLELRDQIFKLLLEHLVLSGRVKVIEADTRDLVSVVLDVNLLL